MFCTIGMGMSVYCGFGHKHIIDSDEHVCHFYCCLDNLLFDYRRFNYIRKHHLYLPFYGIYSMNACIAIRDDFSFTLFAIAISVDPPPETIEGFVMKSFSTLIASSTDL